MVEHHTHTQNTCTHRQVVCSRATASVCYTRQQREHLTLHRSAGEKPIKKTDVRVAAVLADSTKRPTSLYVSYMLMLMSLLQDQSQGLTPEVKERTLVAVGAGGATTPDGTTASLIRHWLLVPGQKFSLCICKKVAWCPRQDLG